MSTARPSLDDTGEWTMVERSPGSDAGSARGVRSLEREGRATTPDGLSDAEEAVAPGATSPGERLADSFLGQPVQEIAAALATATAASLPAAAEPEAADAAHPEQEAIRRLSSMSQEGSLDGFSVTSDGPDDLLLAETADAVAQHEALACEDVGVLALVARLLDGCHLPENVTAAIQTTWQRLAEPASNMLTNISGMYAETMELVGKQLRGTPLWALLALGGIAAVAMAAFAFQLNKNKHLNTQLKHRDRELAKLVVKILHLQDHLHSAMRTGPILTHVYDRYGPGQITLGN